MEREPLSGGRAKVGLVLAGGAARGAYAVGVLEHIVEEVARDIGYDVPLDILCGTSVGAINVCMLAAFADEPRGRVARMASVWTALRADQLLRPLAGGLYDVFRGLLGRKMPFDGGAVFDPAPIDRVLRLAIPFERIDTNLRAGHMHAVTVSTTQIGAGRTVVFVQRARAHGDAWPETRNVVARSVRLRAVHALASAAVPLLFPAVKIDGHYHCDGGIRQNIPLSPARRLGAEAVIVVNPRHRSEPAAEAALVEESAPSPLGVLGKTLNALTLDRIDNEIDRLEKVNEILDAGTERYGPDFTDSLNESLGYPPGKGLRKMRIVHLRSSVNMSALGAEYVRSSSFQLPGVLGRVMKQLAEGEATRDADLLSYLLFDGDFAAQLIDLGRADARRKHAELCALFEAIRIERAREPIAG